MSRAGGSGTVDAQVAVPSRDLAPCLVSWFACALAAMLTLPTLVWRLHCLQAPKAGTPNGYDPF